ncbi:hypothetical protein CcaverHIS002_0100590 [Cutaneotrichosporon cavernicola]|nr:hypothetical protein CcaverHIS002_0100590 [Cutaneotrichosporon cavernicola]BEI95108.1 hypothetical protein CcaverHIS631_0100570 [Cutaneotrichosporon cavernicola]
MSTLATADLGPSDDEDDTDFVLAPPKPKVKGKRLRGLSGSDTSDSEEEGEDDANPKAEALDAEAKARSARAAAAFAEMKAEAWAPRKVETKEEEMVKVQRPRRFAGETIYETVMLRKSDPEVAKLLALQREREATESGSSASASPAPGPRRRKRPRQSLEALAAALDGGKKMTTLEKMDWTSHLSKSKGLSDELAANRKSGGYLEKQAFLDRVGERREAGQEAAQSSRRR